MPVHSVSGVVPDSAGVVRMRSLAARRTMFLIVLTGGVLLAVGLGVLVGARAVSPEDVVAALAGRSDGTEAVVIRTLRAPRTVLGVLVGAALGIAGALIQAMTRNPLADPGLIGVNAGASLAVVVSISFLGASGVIATTGAAVVGAAVALAVVLLLTVRRSVSPLVVVLVGTAVTAAIGGVTSALLIANAAALDQVRYWSIGSLAGRDPELVWPSVMAITVAIVIALVLSVPLATLALGEEAATALGTSVTRTRVLVLGAVALLCGTATAVAGPIAFVGLAVPFLARRLAGADIRWTIAYSALLGAVVLVIADVIGRIVVRPAEMEVGVIVAVVGAPLLILVARTSRIEKP